MGDSWDPFADPAAAEVEEVEDEVEEVEDVPPAAPARPRYCIVASWNDWSLADMTWDAERQIYCFKACLGDEGRDSFQILADGSWNKCIHPDCADACPHVAYNLCGPDASGHDLNWTIGKHASDKAEPGAGYEIRLVVLSSTGTPLVVDWEKISAGKPKIVPSAAADVGASSSSSKKADTEDGRAHSSATTKTKVATTVKEGPPGSVASWLKGGRPGARPAGYQGSTASKETVPTPVRILTDWNGSRSVPLEQPGEQQAASADKPLEDTRKPLETSSPGLLSLEWVEKPPNVQIMDDGWVLLDDTLDNALREGVRKACEGEPGPAFSTDATSSNRLSRVCAVMPVCHLGECGKSSCSLNRSTNPSARPGFLDMVINRILATPYAYLTDDLVYASLGSGELLFDFLILEALKALDINIGQVHLVDPLYEPRACTGLASARLALAQFTRWFPDVAVYAHSSLEELTIRCKRSDIELHFVTVVDCIELTNRWEEVLQPAMEELLVYDGLCFLLSGVSGHSAGSGGARKIPSGISPDAAFAEAWKLDKASGHLKELAKQQWVPKHEVRSEEREIQVDQRLRGW